MESQRLFEAEVEFIKSEGDQRRLVRGYASTESLDQQGETILQNGLDFGPLLKSGFLNYDHQYQHIGGAKVPIIVGYPLKAERRDKGWFVEGELLKSDSANPTSEQLRLANELWELGCALQKSGRRSLSFSVEGGILERRGDKVVKAVVRHLAVTHKPVNPDCTIEVFAKSFYCESGNDKCSHGIEKAMTTQSAAPLMLENLDRNITKVLYGDKQCKCYDQTGLFKSGAAGAMQHLTKCLNYPSPTASRFLRTLITNSTKRPDIAALVKQSGIIRQPSKED